MARWGDRDASDAKAESRKDGRTRAVISPEATAAHAKAPSDSTASHARDHTLRDARAPTWGWEAWRARAIVAGRPSDMILGTGIDIVEVQRIREALDRHGERFALRILTESEWRYCRDHSDPAPCVAARFAAKEAVSKAFGTGIGRELNWHAVEIARADGGRPTVVLGANASRLLAALGGTCVHLSLTHERTHAAAMAILEK